MHRKEKKKVISAETKQISIHAIKYYVVLEKEVKMIALIGAVQDDECGKLLGDSN